MTATPNALDMVQALDRALTLDAVRELDREALRKFESILFNWSEIASLELARRQGGLS